MSLTERQNVGDVFSIKTLVRAGQIGNMQVKMSDLYNLSAPDTICHDTYVKCLKCVSKDYKSGTKRS